MTPEEIRAAIQASQSLKDMIAVGNDVGVAAALTASAPQVSTNVFVTDRDMYYVFGPTGVETFLGKLQAFATGGTTNAKIVARLLTWLKPSEGGINVQDPNTLAVFDALQAGGVISAPENNAIHSMGLKAGVVTTDEVSAAVAVWRPDGKIAPVP